MGSTCDFCCFKGFVAQMFVRCATRMFPFRNLVSTVMRLYSFLSLADTTACTLRAGLDSGVQHSYLRHCPKTCNDEMPFCLLSPADHV